MTKTINEIIKYKSKTWIKFAKINDIDIIDLLKTADRKIYLGKFYETTDEYTINTSECLICGKKLELYHWHDNFYVKYCSCSNDGKNYPSLEKLSTVLPYSKATQIRSKLYDLKTKNLPSKPRYWENLGFTTEEAKKAAYENNRTLIGIIQESNKGKKDISPRQLLFWIKKGYDIQTAEEKLKEYQTRNGLEWYQQKYGNEIGLLLFNERIEKWLISYYHKDNIDDINQKKAWTTENHIEKYGIESYLVRKYNKAMKSIKTRKLNGNACDYDCLSDKMKYYTEVSYYTKQSLKFYFDEINPKREKIGNKDYHIDHMYSICHGFNNKVPSEIIGSYVNLRAIFWKENNSKGPNSCISLQELITKYEEIKNQDRRFGEIYKSIYKSTINE